MSPRRLSTTLVVLCLSSGFAACGDKGTATSDGHGAPATVGTAPATAPTAPAPTTRPGVDGPQTGLAHGSVVFETKQGEVALDVEVAATEDQRRIGLMFRRHLEPGTGMIFLMPSQREQVFWMKNTLIPLDMIFVDEARRVVGVVERTEPLTLSGRTAGVPSRFVIEVPGGFVAASGIARGDAVRLEGIAGLP